MREAGFTLRCWNCGAMIPPEEFYYWNEKIFGKQPIVWSATPFFCESCAKELGLEW